MSVTYNQKTKQIARHKMLKKAVELLTQNRDSICCIRRNYVREIYDFFIELEDSNESKEAKKIENSYIRMWESVHAQYVGNKNADELVVCYFAGPEPENDFNELISLGVLPQNIWAFESEKNTYLHALESIDSTNFSQPKLIKTSIERFFENTPEQFDIVYIDACAPLISEQHALRCISTMFKYHRLASPGILISNFADVDNSNENLMNGYYDAITKYNIIKKYPDCMIVEQVGKLIFKNYYEEIYESVKMNFTKYYGDYITAMLCNVGSIVIPTLRFVNSTYLNVFSNTQPVRNKTYQFQDVNTIKNNTFYKYLAMNCFLKQKLVKDCGIERIDKLEKELTANWNGYTILQSFQKLYEIREQNIGVKANIEEYFNFFEESDCMYQFLDRPTKKLFIDSVINQLAFPMHYCTNKIERLTYIAKETRMYMDLIPFDECRYIYDWLPAVDQMKNAFSNKSWQYVFRFALDGLVKQRINYNNEFFFQGSVISRREPLFRDAIIKDREEIYKGE